MFEEEEINKSAKRWPAQPEQLYVTHTNGVRDLRVQTSRLALKVFKKTKKIEAFYSVVTSPCGLASLYHLLRWCKSAVDLDHIAGVVR